MTYGSNEAFDIVRMYQKDRIYVVPSETTKKVLIDALKYLFENNYKTYVARIRIEGDPTPVG